MRTYLELQRALQSTGALLREAAKALAAMCDDHTVPDSTLEAKRAEITAMQDRMAEYRASMDAARTNRKGVTPMSNIRDMLKSNEYARAFAFAVRNHLNPMTARSFEEAKPLLDAMTESGNSGADGGFLVPEDIDNQINELRRAYDPLAALFSVETVNSNTGWRVIDTAPTTGFSSIDEMGTIGTDAQPSFAKVAYTLAKYGLIVPVSNELAADEDANLFAYLARWFAKKMVITENTLLLAKLNELTATDIAAGNELKGLKGAINKGMDPAIALNATILTNQDGFDAMDNMTDGTGRPLIQANPKDGTPTMFGGKKIHVISNAFLASTSNKAPVYIGDFTQYATLFQRSGMVIDSTNIGGSAYRTDSTEVRGLKRMTVSKFDAAAAVKRTLVV